MLEDDKDKEALDIQDSDSPAVDEAAVQAEEASAVDEAAVQAEEVSAVDETAVQAEEAPAVDEAAVQAEEVSVVDEAATEASVAEKEPPRRKQPEIEEPDATQIRARVSKPQVEVEEEQEDSSSGRTIRIAGIVAAVLLLAGAALLYFFIIKPNRERANQEDHNPVETQAQTMPEMTSEEYLSKAQASEKVGNYGDALAYYKAYLAQEPAHLEIYATMAEIYQLLNYPEEQEKCMADMMGIASHVDRELTEAEVAAVKKVYMRQADAYYVAGDKLMAYQLLTENNILGDILADYEHASEITPVKVVLHKDGMDEDGTIYFGTYPTTEVVSEIFKDVKFNKNNKAKLYGNTYYREEIGGVMRYFTVESVAWKVVQDVDGKYLLMSNQVIDSARFHNELANISWGDSSLRAYLRDVFAPRAFSQEEQALLQTFGNGQSMNPTYANKWGDWVEDQVAILSVEQLYERSNKDFHEHMMNYYKDYMATATDYAAAKGVFRNPQNGGKYWVRTVGVTTEQSMTVGEDGHFASDGQAVDYDGIGVRVAITLSKNDLQ